jgi:hypothetical protein
MVTSGALHKESEFPNFPAFTVVFGKM